MYLTPSRISLCDNTAEMPEISRFFGIVITMWFNDHSEPHFHVRYGEHRAKVA
jgi:hypothetical protein